MSDTEQQYMETNTENGYAVDDLNGAGHTEEAGDGVNEGAGPDADGENGGTEGGQIDASKGEEDAG